MNRLTGKLKANPGQAQRLLALRDTDVTLDVRLSRGSHLRPDAPTATGNAWMAEALESLPAAVRARLVEIEGRVLDWINAKPNNARSFAADPIAALRQAVPDIDNATLESLKQLRGRHSQAPADPGVRIRDVKLGADRGPRP